MFENRHDWLVAKWRMYARTKRAALLRKLKELVHIKRCSCCHSTIAIIAGKPLHVTPVFDAAQQVISAAWDLVEVFAPHYQTVCPECKPFGEKLGEQAVLSASKLRIAALSPGERAELLLKMAASKAWLDLSC